MGASSVQHLSRPYPDRMATVYARPFWGVKLRGACRRGPHRRQNAPVGVAPAKVAGQGLPYLRIRRRRIAVQQGPRRHHEAGRAEPALSPVFIQERLLQRRQLSDRSQPFNRQHLTPVGPHRQHLACVDRRPVQQHGAGATFAAVSAALRFGHLRHFPRNSQG